MKNFIKTFLADESGASAAEYALILAIVGAGIGLAAWTLGNQIQVTLNGAANTIKNCSTATTGTPPSGC